MGLINAGLLSQKERSEAVESNDPERVNAGACVANISPRERLKRLIGGAIPFMMALIVLNWLISINADRLWRLPLFLLFVAAAEGFFQWRDKT